jgi:hypothetical protein
MQLYDFFFESYQNTPKERLLELLAGAADIDELTNLGQAELASIYAERCVYGAMATGFQMGGQKAEVRRIGNDQG